MNDYVLGACDMKEFDEKQNLDGATNENQNPNNAEDKKDLDKAAKLAEIKAEKIQRLKKSHKYPRLRLPKRMHCPRPAQTSPKTG